MTCAVKVMLIAINCLSWAVHESWAQEKCPTGNHCFDVSVHLNGNLLRGPEVVTVIGLHGEWAVSRVNGAFRVPNERLETGHLGVRIVVAGNRLQIPGLLPEVFDTLWDIQLEDRHFPNGRGALAGRERSRHV